MNEKDYLNNFDDDDRYFLDWISNIFTEHIGLIDVKLTILNKTFLISFNKSDNIGWDQFGNQWKNYENPEPVNFSVIDECLDEFNNSKKL